MKMRFKRNVLGYLADRSVCPSGRREDQVLRERYAHSEQLYSKDFVGHYGCVNAIEFSHGIGKHIASGGDDRRVLLWDVEKMLSDIGKPAVMKGEHNSNIFCMAFDIQNKMLFSGGNDEQVIVHDLTTGETKDVFTHDDAVYGLSPDPTNPSVFASSCDDGRVLIFDTRDSCADPFCLANYASSMHSVMYNPVEPRLLATANAKAGVALWDVRKPRTCLLRYGGGLVEQSCMSVRFNQRGDQIIALRRRLPPVLYKIHSSVPVCEFDHSGYYNSCTMKSICFAGDNDQYVLSGSDEFNLYMWALPEDLSERSYINSAHMVLKGHRSIVNQVRFNPSNHLIISSGVEKIIKVWSPFKHHVKQKKCEQDEKSHERRVYTHEEYINLVLQNGNVMSHDYTQESTEEDPRMMAFFDSLVQRELDGWSSDDSLSSNEEALYNRIMAMSQSDIDSDDSFPDLGQDDVDDPAYSPFTIAFASVMASQAVEGNDRFPRLNRALESAERRYAEANNDNPLENNADDSDPNVVQDLQSSDTVSESDEDDNSSHERLTALIKRKKQELKEAMKRRMKYPLAEVFASDSSSSDDGDDDNDVDDGKNKTTDTSTDSLNVQNNGIQEQKSNYKKQDESKESVNAISQIAESNRQAQIKLQKLKDFRKRLLDNDSDGSDLEIHEKKLDSVNDEKKLDLEIDKMKLELESIMNPPESNSSSCVGTERVQFKKFKRRKSVGSDKSIEKDGDSKDTLTVRISPDLGPFLQRAGTSSAVDVRQVAAENEIVERRKGKLSSDSFSFKGKNKLKTSHRHYRESDQRKEDSHKSDSGRNKKSDRDSRERKDRGLSEDGHRRHMFNKPEHRKHDHRHSSQSEHAHKHREHVTHHSEYPYHHGEHLHKHSKHTHKHSGDQHKHGEHLHKHNEQSCKHSGYMHRHSEHTNKHTHRRRSKSDSYIDGDEICLSCNERKEYESGHRHRHRVENEYQNRESHDKDKLSTSLDAIKDDKVGSITEKKHNGEGLHISREGEMDSTKKTEKERRKSENNQNEKNGKIPIYGEERARSKSSIEGRVSIDKKRLANIDSKNDHIQEPGDDMKEIPGKSTSDLKHYLSEEEDIPSRKRSRQIHHMDDKDADNKTDEKFKHEVNNVNANMEVNEIMLSNVNCDVCKNCDIMKNGGTTGSDTIVELYEAKTSVICKKCALPLSSTNITSQNAHSDNSKMGNASDPDSKLTILKVKPPNDFVNDGEQPSCSKNFGDMTVAKETSGQETDPLEYGKPKNKKHFYARKEEINHSRDSSSDEDQLTWQEFKRFKNRMERVRKRYKEEKHQRKMERRHSDDK